jgi:hypothetical protein
MATRKPKNPKHKDALPGEPDIARLYREGGREAPPPALDAAILAEAKRAVQKPAPTKPFHRRWAVPLSTAAVVVVAVSTVLLMTKEGALNHRTELEAPNEYTMAPASPPPLADAREEIQATEPARAKRAAPEPAKTLAESAESKLAKETPAEPMKKTEAPAVTVAPAAAPPALGRAQEADRIGITREEKARARSLPAGAVAMKTQGADVVAVQASGSPGAYTFNVTVQSPDTGCQQYADWWEVVSEDGKLLYRRVLLHSHVGEQPFARSGGPVPIAADTVVWVRAHMNTSGYDGAAIKGSVKTGFKPAVPDAGFAAGLAKQPPLPEGCDF